RKGTVLSNSSRSFGDITSRRTRIVAAYQRPVLDIHPVGDLRPLDRHAIAELDRRYLLRLVVHRAVELGTVVTDRGEPDVLLVLPIRESHLDRKRGLHSFRGAQGSDERLNAPARLLDSGVHARVIVGDIGHLWFSRLFPAAHGNGDQQTDNE